MTPPASGAVPEPAGTDPAAADITASESRAGAEDEVREDAGAAPDAAPNAPAEAVVESLPLAATTDEPAIALPPTPPEEDAEEAEDVEHTPKPPTRRGWWRRPSI